MKIRNPRWARYWSDDIVIRLATIGSLGRMKAPGTWGSLAGLIFYAAIVGHLNEVFAVVLLAAATYFAVGICGEAEKRLKKVDPGEIILDEFVAMPMCLIGLQPFMGQGYSLLILLAAFALFRVFDILKPFGIKSLQRYHGGFGVVIDDVAAALMVCAIMNVGVRLIL